MSDTTVITDDDTDVADTHPDEDAAIADDTGEDETMEDQRTRRRLSATGAALVVGLLTVVALGALGGWLGWQDRQYRQNTERNNAFVQAARQGALNLTTIDWNHADSDVQRIIDTATGTFYDDFTKRSAPFIEVVKQAQSTSKGTVVSAGLQSESGDEAQVLVAVKVNVSNAGAAEQQPRSWRMRMTVQKVGDDVKVSNVEFVP